MPASLRSFTPADILARLPELGALLQVCVHDGASIGFILPFDVAASQAFWTDNVLPAVTRGVRLLLVAEIDGRVAGAVQLDWTPIPTRRTGPKCASCWSRPRTAASASRAS